MIVRHISWSNLFYTLYLLFLFPISVFSQSRDALDMVLSEKDKADVVDIIETSKTISAESQAKIKDYLGKWEQLENNFPNLPGYMQDFINKMNAAGIKTKLNATLKGFEKYDTGLKGLMDKKEKVDQVINFYDRYKPDSQNPFRSLEVLNNIFTDAESLLPEETEYEYIRKPTVWLIRVGIGYFKEGIGNALNGLKDIQKQIRNRAGNCIGYVGGDGTADSSDPKRKAFTDLGTGDIICYTGVRPIGGEVWSNTNGDGVFVWHSNKWTKLKCGLGEANDVFYYWRLANGETIKAGNYIYWCNNRLGEFRKARARGEMQFDKLSTKDYCHEYILTILGKTTELKNLLNTTNNNKKQFAAKYIFKKDGVRVSAEQLAYTISDNAIIEGVVKNPEGNSVNNANVNIEAGSETYSKNTDEKGFFRIIARIPEKDHSGLPFKITVTTNGFNDLEDSSIMQEQCTNLGALYLKANGQLIITPSDSKIKIGETVKFTVLFSNNSGSKDVTPEALNNSEFAGTTEGNFSIQALYGNYTAIASVQVTKENQCDDANEIWDATLEDCVCKEGYKKNESDECVEIANNDSSEIICTDPNSEKYWDEALQKYTCVCKTGFTTDPSTGLCVQDINCLLSQADCANVQGAVAEWDPVSQQVICSCVDPYHTWDPAQKKCVPNVQAILDNSDCSQWLNTEPKWDYSSNEPYCDCIAGYEWNEDFTQCLSKQDIQVAQTDCSQYPNTQPIWDPVNEEVICDCLPGYEWDENYTKCISKSLAVLQNTDCSGYPNTEAIWDPVSQQAYCDCLPGYQWNADYTACEKLMQQQQQQQPQFDCSHLPNSRPVFDPVLNETVCDCMPGYQWNRNQTACVPIPKKPTVDWGGILNVTMDIMNAVNGNNPAMPTGYPSVSGNTINSAMNQQQPVRHQSNCNDQQQAGANTPEEHTIDLGQSFGSFMFDYQTFTEEDQIIITNGGRTIFNSGCVGENKSVRLNLSGFSPVITVRVNPNCDGGTSTQWNFT
ncbi:MAG: carboxypeptidase-like regulatory domain-containing protein, partial [Bacteroidota bacterium]